MCGIVGYVGTGNALPILLEGLKRLEYRGYDSAGVAVLNNGSMEFRKAEGKIAVLEEELSCDLPPAGNIGIGHTRWATHGRPSDNNAHPHADCSGCIAVVHNGIIENYVALRNWLEEEGHVFRSETDTEVIPHLIEHYFRGDLEAAVRQAVKQLRGSYALAVICRDQPDRLVAVRQDSPLVVGLGAGANHLASDIPALLQHTRKAVILEDGEVAVITRDRVWVGDREGQTVAKDIYEVSWDPVLAEKGGYRHFMLKEIMEQPRALKDTMAGRISDDGARVLLDEVKLTPDEIRTFDRVHIVACGTAYHAGLVSRYLLEKLVLIPAEAEVASEYRYRDPLVNEKTLMLIISQSGETADTLAALREGKRRGARVVAVTNVLGSSVAREAHDVIYTWAGPEIAVASTKAYTTQILALTLFTLFMAQQRGTLSAEDQMEILNSLRHLPEKAARTLELDRLVEEVAGRLARWEDLFFIGRGLDYALALEGQLKLKEISYIHAEAYPAGELKHGTLALIERGVPVVALATQEHLLEKTISNITEVKARGAEVIGIAVEGNDEIKKHADTVIYVPGVHPLVQPIVTALPLQLIAYHAAVVRGCDVDQPRNLAKSVTVE